VLLTGLQRPDAGHGSPSVVSEVARLSSFLVQVLAQLERCRAYPDFNNYLALILAQGNTLQLEVMSRSLHGQAVCASCCVCCR
jgi:hypothetical protein